VKTTFGSLNGLIKRYEQLKLELEAARGVKIDKNTDFQKTNSALSSQDILEGKFALVADVEICIKHFCESQKAHVPVPLNYLMEIFHSTFCTRLTGGKTYGQQALRYRGRLSNGTQLPKRLTDKSNLYRLAQELKVFAGKYFEEREIIVKDEFVSL
jgi:hypothetical protein